MIFNKFDNHECSRISLRQKLHCAAILSLQVSSFAPFKRNMNKRQWRAIKTKMKWCMLLTVLCSTVVKLQNVVYRAGRCVTCHNPGELPDLTRRLSVSPHTMAEKPLANCVFCQICGDNPSGTELLVSADDLVVFRDIKPAAKHHYLVVSREHITDAKALTPAHKPLVERMVSVAEQVLREQNADMSDFRLGFHWPPFHSISHLHLHAISRTADMGFMARLIFKPNTWWFVSPEYVLSRL